MPRRLASEQSLSCEQTQQHWAWCDRGQGHID